YVPMCRVHLCRQCCLSDYCCSNAPPTTEIYTLSLHDALPIYVQLALRRGARLRADARDDHCNACLQPLFPAPPQSARPLIASQPSTVKITKKGTEDEFFILGRV